MAAFLAGVFVTLFLLVAGGIGYVLGSTGKTKVQIPDQFKPQFDENFEKQRLVQEKYKQDFNVMMNYNQVMAYQPKREIGE
jgi:hypothetical protein